MQLSEIGKILKIEWLKTFEIRPDMNLSMSEYVVMPNHFHGIVVIGENEFNFDGDGRRGGNGDDGRDAMHCISTIQRFKLALLQFVSFHKRIIIAIYIYYRDAMQCVCTRKKIKQI
jgi:hypothetical protein